MKRSLLIILGVLLVLILVGIWVYVLLTGSTNNTSNNQFNEFGFGDTTDPNAINAIQQTEPEPVVNVGSGKKLQQLTTKRVVGYTEVNTSTTTNPRVHYVEAGTGHIYSIDLVTGEEDRVSATTIPLATAAALTPNGAHVMMQAGQAGDTEFIIGNLATSSDVLSNFALPEPVMSFTATVGSEFLYIVPDGNGAVAKAYNPRTNASRVLFTVPFREVAVSWHHTAAGPHLVYPKANSQLEGFVYSYTNGVRTRLPISGYGLSAVGSETDTLFSQATADGYITTSYNKADQRTSAQPITTIPEKCAFSPINATYAICGATLQEYGINMPDAWYTGDMVTNDGLWEFQTDSGSASYLVDVTAETGQTMDLTNPRYNTTGSNLYFQNKIDQTLWIYKLID